MTSKLPNILIFMTDQQRGDTVLDQKIIMPNLRKLMKRGITFTEAYCPSPHCCPSRASFFTSRYPSEHGIWNNVCVGNALSREISPSIELFSHHLNAAGYQQYYAGKWHVSDVTGPVDHGFTELHVTCNKAIMNDPTSQAMAPGWDFYRAVAEQKAIQSTSSIPPGTIIREGYPDYVHYGTDEDPFNDREVVESAIEKLRNIRLDQEENPWLMYIGTLGPHDPYLVPKQFLELYQDVDIELTEIHHDEMIDKPVMNRLIRGVFSQLSEEEKKDAIRHYMAFCTYEDHLFGLIMTELEKHPDVDNTMIVYLSDHGDYNGEHGLWCKGLPAFKGAYHIPAVIAWNNGILNQDKKIDNLISLTDFGVTFLEVAGKKIHDKVPGKSLTPYFKSEHDYEPHEHLFTQSNGNEIYGIQRCIFNKKWKLVHNTYDIDELYDLENDPNEITNLSTHASLKGVRKSLFKSLWGFAYENNDPIISPYIITGISEFGPAVLFEK